MATYVTITNTTGANLNANGFSISGHEVKHLVIEGDFEFIQNSSGRLILVDFGNSNGHFMPYTASDSATPGRGLIPQLQHGSLNIQGGLKWEIYGTLDEAIRDDVDSRITNE